MQTDTEFESNGHTYKIGRLNAYQQFHLSRRIAPLIPPLVPIFLKLSREGFNGDLTELPQLLQPFANGLSVMKDEDADAVIDMCLSTVKRQVASSWATIWAGKRSPFDELNDLGAIMPIVIRVIQHNLGPFFVGMLTGQHPAAQPAA